MIVKQNVTVYKCDYCRKYGLSKSNIRKHEQFCFKNPDNVPKCFDGCKHLCSGTNDEGAKYYRCDKKNTGMFSKKQVVLGRNLVGWNAIEMPHECTDFEVDIYEANF